MAPPGSPGLSLPDLLLSDVAGLHAGGPAELAYIADAGYLPALAASKAGACFVTEKWATSAPSGMALLIVKDPRAAFAVAAGLFYPDALSSPANLPPPAVAADAEIAPTAVLANGVVVGAGARIGHGAVIGAGVSIGAGTVIAAHVTLSHCIVGARTIIHPGARIGQDGFGFAPGGRGIIKIPQLGRVVIGDEVEIGANTAIDRGALEDTVIGDGTKIDNLVQIGHNVVIGRMCLIAAQVGISGSCRIGDGVMIGGDAGLADHVVVGNGARIGAKAGVMREIGAGEAVMGYPAQPIRQFWREIATVSRLTRRDK